MRQLPLGRAATGPAPRCHPLATMGAMAHHGARQLTLTPQHGQPHVSPPVAHCPMGPPLAPRCPPWNHGSGPNIGAVIMNSHKCMLMVGQKDNYFERRCESNVTTQNALATPIFKHVFVIWLIITFIALCAFG